MKTKMWYITLVKNIDKFYIKTSLRKPAISDRMCGRSFWRFRTITPQAATRKFIRGTLPAIVAVMDDGGNGVADTKGKDGKKYVKNRLQAFMEYTLSGKLKVVVDKSED